MNYAEFLESKKLIVKPVGIEADLSRFPKEMFPHERDLAKWALIKGRSAIFATTGMGKTIMALAWAEQAAEQALILAPLAVTQQTVREGEKFGIKVTYAATLGITEVEAVAAYLQALKEKESENEGPVPAN